MTTRQSAAPLTVTPSTITRRSAREVARLAEDGDLDLAPAYQRGDVWTQDQRIALVKSFIEGVPVPSLYLNDRFAVARGAGLDLPDVAYAVIDGRQRLTTLIAWFAGALAVPASWFRAEVVDSTVETEDGRYVTYLGLARSERTAQGTDWSIAVCEARVASIQQEAALYLQVNGGGTAQADQDLLNASLVAQGN